LDGFETFSGNDQFDNVLSNMTPEIVWLVGSNSYTYKHIDAICQLLRLNQTFVGKIDG